MPMPKPVCRTRIYNKIVQLEVCRTFSGRGMGLNGTAHIRHCPAPAEAAEALERPLHAPGALGQRALADGIGAPDSSPRNSVNWCF